MPGNLHIEVRVALLRDGKKSLRWVSRANTIPERTIRDVISGRCGLRKDSPSVRAFQVLRALMPWLPADFAVKLRAEFPAIFAAKPKAASAPSAKSAVKKSGRGKR